MKTNIIQKLFVLILVAVTALGTASVASAQTKGLSVSLKDKPLKQFIKAVERQTDYKFFYEEHAIDADTPVTVYVKDVTVSQALDAALKGKPISYEISGKRIMLMPKKTAPQSKAKKLVLKGQVLDVNGEPVISAGVFEKGTDNGTVTDLDGNYSISVSSDAVLEVSCIGYESQNVLAGSQNFSKIVLMEDTSTLDESVVVGYGSVRKRDLTGSVASVRGEDLETEGLTSVGQAMQGKAAGLYVRQNSAQPGGGLEILVRGAGSVNASNEPLYIVDGFPIAKLDQPSSYLDYNDPGTQGVLNFLNPNDVQSIEVLKDASATAIYGARAANGVVIITTKRGSLGRAKVDYSYSYSLQKPADKYDVLSLKDYMQVRNETYTMDWMINNEISPFGAKTWEDAMASPYKGIVYNKPYEDSAISSAKEGTDWLGLVTRNGQIHEHNLSVRGGSENTQYMVSMNYYDHKGIVINNGIDRYTIKSNIDQKIFDFLKMGTNITLTRMDNDNIGLGTALGTGTGGIIRNAVIFSPALQAYDAETDSYPIMENAANWANPYSQRENTDKGRTDRLLGNIYFELTPLKGLTVKFNTGIDHANISRKTYQDSHTLLGGRKNGIAKIFNTENNQYLMELTANYAKTFNKIHALNLLAGMSGEKFNYDASTMSNTDFITNAFIYNNMGAGAGTPEVTSASTSNLMRSYFFRAGYVLKERYLLTATLRADGASVFAENNKWGYFPSVALGWIISDEPFMSNADWISNLKMRLSYGQTGNADIVTNAYGAYGIYNSYVTEKDVTQKGIITKRLSNPDLKWETTTEWNLGLDFGFFNERISGSVELYQRTISDLLNTRYLNTYQPVSSVIANIGKTRSRGIELTLNTRNITRQDFSWNTAFTFASYRDNWLERTDDWTPKIYESAQDPIRAIYALKADHVMQTGETAPSAQPDLIPGQLVIKDLDSYAKDSDGKVITDGNGYFVKAGKADNRIDDADVVLLGTTDPGWLASMTNTFRYRNLDFSFMFNGMFDRMMKDPTLDAYGPNFAPNVAGAGFNAVSAIKERWTPENPSTKYPSGFSSKKTTQYTTVGNDWFYEKAWFIRMQNITIGYRLPSRLLDWARHISSIRLNLSANNLFIITPYGGLDPETDIQSGAYPNARTFTAGVNVSF